MDTYKAKQDSGKLDAILPAAFRYASRKKIANQSLQQFKRSSLIEFPQENQDIMQGMLVAGRLFTDASRVAAFLRGGADQLTGDPLQLVRVWRSTPWFFAAVEVLDRPQDAVFEVRGIGAQPDGFPADDNWSRMTLYSPATANLYAEGRTRMFSLFWKATDHWQTYGALVALTHMPKDRDVFYYSELTANIPGKNRNSDHRIIGSIPDEMESDTIQQNLCDSMASNPLAWLRLLEISHVPPVGNPRFTFGMYASAADLPDSTNQPDPTDMTIEVGRHLQQAGIGCEVKSIDESVYASITLPDRPGDMSALYLDTDYEAAFLKTAALESYTELQQVLRPFFSFPATPMLDVNFALYMYASQWYAPDDQLHDLIDLFAEEEPADDTQVSSSQADTSQLNAVLGLINTAYNNGTSISDEEIVRQTGASRDMVQQMRAVLAKSLENMGVDGSPGPFDLPPAEVHELTQMPFPDQSRHISLHRLEAIPAEMYETVPVLRLYQAMFACSPETGLLPLTASGYLKPIVVQQLASALPDLVEEHGEGLQYTKKEGDWYWLGRMRRLLVDAQLLVKEKNGLRVSTASPVIAENLPQIYRELLQTLLQRHPWEEHAMSTEKPEHWVHRTGPLLMYGIVKCSHGTGTTSTTELAQHLTRYIPEFRRFLTENPDLPPDSNKSPVWYVELTAVIPFLYFFAIPMGLAQYQSAATPADYPRQVQPTELLRQLVT